MTSHPQINALDKEEDRIRVVAYSLWEEEGCPEGRAHEHWIRACALVEAEVTSLPDTSGTNATAKPSWLVSKTAVELPKTVETPTTPEPLAKPGSTKKVA